MQILRANKNEFCMKNNDLNIVLFYKNGNFYGFKFLRITSQRTPLEQAVHEVREEGKKISQSSQNPKSCLAENPF